MTESWATQQPHAPVPPVRPWYKKKRFAIPLGLFTFFTVLAIVLPDSEEPSVAVANASATSEPATKPAASAKAKTPKAAVATTVPPAKPKVIGIGSKVRDGKFEFVVKSINTKKSIGSDYARQKAQGKFLLITIKVTNIGDEAQTFFGSNQKLIDGKGREFSSDDSAAMYLDDSKSFIEEINPGNSLTGVVVFDVPKAMKPVKIELHDSAFSGGKTVALS